MDSQRELARFREIGWVQHIFRGCIFFLPREYVKVVDFAFQDYKFHEFECRKAFAGDAEHRDEWGLDLRFRDGPLLDELSQHFKSLHFSFWDGRLYVERKPRLVHDYSLALLRQLSCFVGRTGGSIRNWTFPGASSLFKRSRVRQAMMPDVSIVPSCNLTEKLKLVEDKGGEVPVDVEGMICLEVATSSEEDVHQTCSNMVAVMGVELALGFFPLKGLVRVYHRDESSSEELDLRTAMYVDVGVVIPGFRFYLTALRENFRITGPCYCHCNLDWLGMRFDETVAAVCSHIVHGHNACAEEGVFFLETVNVVDCKGQVPMVVAAETSNTHMLDFLCSQGADVHFRDKRGIYPLLAAAGISGSQAWMTSRGHVFAPSLADVMLVLKQHREGNSSPWLVAVLKTAQSRVLEECMSNLVFRRWLPGIKLLHELTGVAFPKNSIAVGCCTSNTPMVEYIVRNGMPVTCWDVVRAHNNQVRNLLFSKLDDQAREKYNKFIHYRGRMPDNLESDSESGSESQSGSGSCSCSGSGSSSQSE